MTLHKVELGSATVAIGTVFELAILVGIPLFGASDRVALSERRDHSRTRLALLPHRVREPVDADDNF